MRCVGVDGCRRGWVAVTLDGDDRQYALLKRIDEVAGDRVLIDIPIGLPEKGRRACDLAARKMLGPAWPRVFLDARRPLLGLANHAEANAWGRKNDDAGVSVQLWAIMPKIKEVDAYITPERQDAIREAHPELAFLRLNDGTPVHAGKKTAEGRKQRRDIIHDAGLPEIDAWLGALRGTGAGADDLLDACVLALAARDPQRLGDGATDRRGLRMEIWY